MYYLIVTEEQSKVISKALDLYARIGIGQFEELLRHPTWDKKHMDGDIKHNDLNVAGDWLNSVKHLITGYEANASQSIVASDEHNKIAYDLLQVIEYTLNKGKHLSSGHIARRKPMRWADHGLANMKRMHTIEEIVDILDPPVKAATHGLAAMEKVPFETRAGAAHVGDADDIEMPTQEDADRLFPPLKPEDIERKDKVISVANLPEELTIKDPLTYKPKILKGDSNG